MKDDGGPAFPVGDQSLHPLMVGMSLRDYFAAAALVQLTAPKGFHRTENIVGYAYEIADAMLKERAK